MSVLLDSNIVINLLRSRPSALAFMAAQTSPPFVSPMTLLELYSGFRSRVEEREGEDLFANFRLAKTDDLDVWRRAGQYMKHYRASHGLDDMDALIAATAEHHGLKLATLNVKHFPMLKGLKRAY